MSGIPYPPPTENLPIFDDSVFIQSTSGQSSTTALNIRTSATSSATPLPIAILSTATAGTSKIYVDSTNGITYTPSTDTLNLLNLGVSGLATFSTVCPQTPAVPINPNDLINLSYFNNNNPSSGVLFYLNNSLTPVPPISTYAQLGSAEDGSAQSSIPTTISGINTIQFIKGFANTLATLSIGTFIPSGIFDLYIFASASTAGDTTHINLYFSLWGRTSGGVETQIGTNSGLVSVDAITVEQLKMSLAIPYTDMSPYTSIVLKVYGICNRSPATSITTFYEGTTTYSNLRTPLSTYVPPSILSLNNVFTGTNQFTQTITGSITGNSATSTTSNTTLSAPDSALSANVPLKDATNVFTGGSNTFDNVLTTTGYETFVNPLVNTFISSGATLAPPLPPSFTTGNYNVCIGYATGNAITTGIENMLVGRNTAQTLTTGQRNCAFGNASLGSCGVDISLNSAFGYRAGLFAQSGSNSNVFLGPSCGTSALSTNCCYIGSGSLPASTITLYNQSVALGANSRITASNQIVLGTATETTNILGSLTVSGAITGTVSTANNVALTSDNTLGSYFIPFSKTATTSNALYIDDVTGPLTYNPSTSTLTATTFSGTASASLTTTAIGLTSDNTAGTYYLPFSKTTSVGANVLYIDNTTTPLTYNPSTSNLSAGQITATGGRNTGWSSGSFWVQASTTTGQTTVKTTLTPLTFVGGSAVGDTVAGGIPFNITTGLFTPAVTGAYMITFTSAFGITATTPSISFGVYNSVGITQVSNCFQNYLLTTQALPFQFTPSGSFIGVLTAGQSYGVYYSLTTFVGAPQTNFPSMTIHKLM